MSHDTYSIAGIDVTRDIVTAIYVVDFTSQHSDTCSVTCRNVVRVILGVKCYLRIRHRCSIVVVIERLHVSFTTTAIDVIDHHSCTFNLHKQTFRTGHTSLVTATIEVADSSFLQIPSGTDSHIRLVVSAKETSYLVGITAWIRESGVDPHYLEARFGKQFAFTLCSHASIFDTVDNLARVVEANDRFISDSGIITATICIDDRTSKKFQVGLTELW